MKDATTISRYAGRNQATLMTISFQGRSGQIAANVVNEYVTLVLEENSEFRVSRAESTLTFFEQEVERLGEDLDRQSTQIALFKADNIEALPEDQNYRLGRQALLQERVARLERERSATVQQRDEVLRIFESTGMVGGSAQRLRTPEQEQMIVVEADLERAISIYSENHPRVIRLQARLDRLQAIVTAQLEANAGIQDLESNASPQEFMLQANIAQLDGRLQLIDADLTSTKDELGGLQEAIADSSANGIALSALERDYQNIQARYNAAVNNLNSARMSERIESTAQGQRITVIENAVVPRVPTGPDRPRTAIMGAAFGIVLAGAYFMLLELLNRAIRRPEELISRFEVTPIAVVPYMESRTQRLIRRGSIIATTVLVLLGVPLLLWYIDTQYLPLELIVEKGLDKLGLG
ncbi:MAG: chain length-determining protein, partial [Pseudomonadota bacterium]